MSVDNKATVGDKWTDLLRLDGRLFRVVGRTVIDGVEHKVCAPVGRGPLRAVPVEDVPPGETERQRIVSGRQEPRPPSAGQKPPRSRRRTLTPSQRLHRACWPAPGRIGCLPIAALVATIVALTLALG